MSVAAKSSRHNSTAQSILAKTIVVPVDGELLIGLGDLLLNRGAHASTNSLSTACGVVFHKPNSFVSNAPSPVSLMLSDAGNGCPRHGKSPPS
jgi:hypothetical protein